MTTQLTHPGGAFGSRVGVEQLARADTSGMWPGPQLATAAGDTGAVPRHAPIAPSARFAGVASRVAMRAEADDDHHHHPEYAKTHKQQSNNWILLPILQALRRQEDKQIDKDHDHPETRMLLHVALGIIVLGVAYLVLKR